MNEGFTLEDVGYILLTISLIPIGILGGRQLLFIASQKDPTISQILKTMGLVGVMCFIVLIGVFVPIASIPPLNRFIFSGVCGFGFASAITLYIVSWHKFKKISIRWIRKRFGHEDL